MPKDFAPDEPRLECVVNISEGRRPDVLEKLAHSLNPTDLLDVHVDPWHHRSVWTLLGTNAPRKLTKLAIELIDIHDHQGGVHPRLGVVDVVPFVPLGRATMDQAVAARDEFATWLAFEMNVPSFLYGPDIPPDNAHRTLPEIRRQAWKELRPDKGPHSPHPVAGAVCVGARHPLVAFNIWLGPGSDWLRATEITAALRTPYVRALTLRVASHIQISMNLIEPTTVGPADVYEQVRALAESRSIAIDRAELVGLVDQTVLEAIAPADWARLDVAPERTIEYRMTHGYRFSTR